MDFFLDTILHRSFNEIFSNRMHGLFYLEDGRMGGSFSFAKVLQSLKSGLNLLSLIALNGAISVHNSTSGDVHIWSEELL